jgi:hypothetical protein
MGIPELPLLTEVYTHSLYASELDTSLVKSGGGNDGGGGEKSPRQCNFKFKLSTVCYNSWLFTLA